MSSSIFDNLSNKDLINVLAEALLNDLIPVKTVLQKLKAVKIPEDESLESYNPNDGDGTGDGYEEEKPDSDDDERQSDLIGDKRKKKSISPAKKKHEKKGSNKNSKGVSKKPVSKKSIKKKNRRTFHEDVINDEDFILGRPSASKEKATPMEIAECRKRIDEEPRNFLEVLPNEVLERIAYFLMRSGNQGAVNKMADSSPRLKEWFSNNNFMNAFLEGRGLNEGILFGLGGFVRYEESGWTQALSNPEKYEDVLKERLGGIERNELWLEGLGDTFLSLIATRILACQPELFTQESTKMADARLFASEMVLPWDPTTKVIDSAARLMADCCATFINCARQGHASLSLLRANREELSRLSLKYSHFEPKDKPPTGFHENVPILGIPSEVCIDSIGEKSVYLWINNMLPSVSQSFFEAENKNKRSSSYSLNNKNSVPHQDLILLVKKHTFADKTEHNRLPKYDLENYIYYRSKLADRDERKAKAKNNKNKKRRKGAREGEEVAEPIYHIDGTMEEVTDHQEGGAGAGGGNLPNQPVNNGGPDESIEEIYKRLYQEFQRKELEEMDLQTPIVVGESDARRYLKLLGLWLQKRNKEASQRQKELMDFLKKKREKGDARLSWAAENTDLDILEQLAPETLENIRREMSKLESIEKSKESYDEAIRRYEKKKSMVRSEPPDSNNLFALTLLSRVLKKIRSVHGHRDTKFFTCTASTVLIAVYSAYLQIQVALETLCRTYHSWKDKLPQRNELWTVGSKAEGRLLSQAYKVMLAEGTYLTNDTKTLLMCANGKYGIEDYQSWWRVVNSSLRDNRAWVHHTVSGASINPNFLLFATDPKSQNQIIFQTTTTETSTAGLGGNSKEPGSRMRSQPRLSVREANYDRTKVYYAGPVVIDRDTHNHINAYRKMEIECSFWGSGSGNNDGSLYLVLVPGRKPGKNERTLKITAETFEGRMLIDAQKEEKFKERDTKQQKERKRIPLSLKLIGKDEIYSHREVPSQTFSVGSDISPLRIEDPMKVTLKDSVVRASNEEVYAKLMSMDLSDVSPMRLGMRKRLLSEEGDGDTKNLSYLEANEEDFMEIDEIVDEVRDTLQMRPNHESRLTRYSISVFDKSGAKDLRYAIIFETPKGRFVCHYTYDGPDRYTRFVFWGERDNKWEPLHNGGDPTEWRQLAGKDAVLVVEEFMRIIFMVSTTAEFSKGSEYAVREFGNKLSVNDYRYLYDSFHFKKDVNRLRSDLLVQPLRIWIFWKESTIASSDANTRKMTTSRFYINTYSHGFYRFEYKTVDNSLEYSGSLIYDKQVRGKDTHNVMNRYLQDEFKKTDYTQLGRWNGSGPLKILDEMLAMITYQGNMKVGKYYPDEIKNSLDILQMRKLHLSLNGNFVDNLQYDAIEEPKKQTNRI